MAELQIGWPATVYHFTKPPRLTFGSVEGAFARLYLRYYPSPPG